MYSILDIETTGGSYKREKMTEIAIFLFDGEKVVDSYETLLNPGMPIPPFVEKLTGITNEMVAKAPTFDQVADKINDLTQNTVIVAHNSQFDYGFLKQEFKNIGQDFKRKKLCTVELSKKILLGHNSYSLGNLCKDLGIEITGRHRAAGDAEATVKLFDILLKNDTSNYIKTYSSLEKLADFIAPNLSVKKIIDLPEDTGVFYLHDANGNVLYLKRTNDISNRVEQMVIFEPEGVRRKEMFEKIADVSYQISGSELVAKLWEQRELQYLRPEYNRIQGQKWMMKSVENSEGFLELKPARIRKTDHPIAVYRNRTDVEAALWRRVERHKLCPVLCNLREKKKQDLPCDYYRQGLCMGACEKRVNYKQYNQKVKKSIKKFKYKHPNFLIIGEGRTVDEISAICIKNEQYCGFKFYDKNSIPDISEIIEDFKPQDYSAYARRIIRDYLGQNNFDEIVPFDIE